MGRLRVALTYANTMATIAVFLALGGGAYAATQLAKNSVGTKQIKRNAVVSSKVKNGTLLKRDFRAGQLPAGPQGLQGPQGNAGQDGTNGSPGPAGTARAYALVTSNGLVIRSHNVSSITHAPGSASYCVELDPSVPAAGTGAVAMPYYSGDTTATGTPGRFAHVEYVGSCGTNGQQVLTFEVVPNSGVADHDEGFFIAVP